MRNEYNDALRITHCAPRANSRVFDTPMTDSSPHDTVEEDAALLHQVAQGDLAALEQLFIRYQRQIYQLALGITRDAETAEEVLQDTFYRLYNHAGELDRSLPLLPW